MFRQEQIELINCAGFTCDISEGNICSEQGSFRHDIEYHTYIYRGSEQACFLTTRVERPLKYQCSFQARLSLSLGMAPVLFPLRPSSEVTDNPSKLARFSLHRVAWLILECARRTSTFRACAFREQEDGQAAPSLPSEAARCVSTEDHQAPSPPFLSGRDDMMNPILQIEFLIHTFKRESWP